MTPLAERARALEEQLERRILCLDGAMGTALQACNLTAADFGGEALEGCNEHLNLTRPDLIGAIHDAHLAAGADIVETNTFGSTDLVLAEYPPLDRQAHAITVAGARIAREAADRHAAAGRPRFVAGSMGPTTKAISVTGGVTFERLVATFRAQAAALIEGGVDYLLLETCQDTRNVKAGLLGCHAAMEEAGVELPLAVSGTIEPMGTMLAGQTAEALAISLAHERLLYLGLNCATGPDFMTDHIRALSELARTRVACVPNAGLPDENGLYLETPATLARIVGRFVDQGWINLVGGCCGTRADHIAALANLVEGRAPRRIPTTRRSTVSGLEAVELEESNRPLLVGERTNVLGSRVFKGLIAAGKYEEGAEIARRQVKGGAQILDVCLQDPDRDEAEDVRRFLEQLIRMVKAPLMIDSTDARVLELGLTYSQGKAILNSVNLEDGLERFERVVPLAKRYGAALVVGCIDEDKAQGMAVTRERKLAVARRSHEILTRQFGIEPEDIYFDPLVFPCATGDANYLGSARETVEGIRLIKEALPGCKTILGISNVSFGLPAAGREVLNSVFLYHCTKAGLDLAIVNTEKLERYPSIPELERRLSERVLFDTSDEAIAEFAALFRDKKPSAARPASQLSLDERLAAYIVTGSKDGLIADLEAKRKEAAPLDIINGPLMAGMDEVGRLFNANELIVAEVLQSAEAMKAAVAHLERFLEKDEASSRGTVLLATVKGDVHDIGKNLVEIILANNGYRVVNLGIKVPPHELIEAIEKHDPDLVGLSGLLVKSAQQMVITAEELSVHGRCPPLLVGGAALTRAFTRRRIAPAYKGLVAYAKDAMQGLALANRLGAPADRPGLEAELEEEERRFAREQAEAPSPAPLPPDLRSSVRVLEETPAPPDTELHVMRRLPLDEVWAYVNPLMLYGKHLGLKGRFEELRERGDATALQLGELIDAIKAESRPGGAAPMQARAVWRFFPASSEGKTLTLHEPSAPHPPAARFLFPRQAKGDRLCLADFVRPKEGDAPPRDHACLFVVTAGEGVRARAEELKARGEFLKSHAVQALALETAEAAAEWLHHRLREQWGIGDPAGTTMLDRFRAHYRGKRYSPGYPACPDLGLQRDLFRLLGPDAIGVQLTEECMMDPEASVSALILHHPDARYFTAGRDEA
ncbi:MAG: methionine synthase [Planctomycetaceae bacterium]